MNGTVLVTGASGFVGGALVARLLKDGIPVRAAVRQRASARNFVAGTVVVGDLSSTTDWGAALDGVVAVVHCAARVHKLRDPAQDPLAAFMAVNRDATAHLARAAAAAGVRRFIYLSSIGVNGAETFDRPFRADDAPAPHSDYARSKLGAEVALQGIAAGNPGFGATIVRPPLVYGPEAPGHFATLLRAVYRGVPLPFGAVTNRRSFVAIDNLVDLLAICLRNSAAPGRTLLVSDGEDLSTTDLLRRTARALGRRALLVPVPVGWLRAASAVLGRGEQARSLLGSLQIDLSEAREALGWSPPVRVDAALETTARHFLQGQARDRNAVG